MMEERRAVTNNDSAHGLTVERRNGEGFRGVLCALLNDRLLADRHVLTLGCLSDRNSQLQILRQETNPLTAKITRH